LAQAYLLAEKFLAGAPSAMILGDNIFYGHGLPSLLDTAASKVVGGSVFGYHVTDPSRYGVVSFDEQGNVRAVEEKPVVPKSNYAVTGLYFLDGTASEKAKKVKPSDRGELEITSLLECYLEEGTLDVRLMGRGYAWFDTGTHDSLLDAGNFVRTLQKRQGMLIGSPEEIAYQKNWIAAEQLRELVQRNKYTKSDYGQFLLKLCEEEGNL
jgi:glucose-1-phosphate thymidylyltransferase